MTTEEKVKPLGQKSYGSIAHLPHSRLGPGDHKLNEGQARILTCKTRDKHDEIFVTEKLDGSCMSVARQGDSILALGRVGYRACTSRFPFQRAFAQWVADNEDTFRGILVDGERLVGEWMYLVHGTIYHGLTDYWYPFDLMAKSQRIPYLSLLERLQGTGLETPRLLYTGNEALPVQDALAVLGPEGCYGAEECPEGAVWRVERRGKVDFLGKLVQPGKIDGKYLVGVGEVGKDMYHRLNPDNVPPVHFGQSWTHEKPLDNLHSS